MNKKINKKVDIFYNSLAAAMSLVSVGFIVLAFRVLFNGFFRYFDATTGDLRYDDFSDFFVILVGFVPGIIAFGYYLWF